MSTVYRKKAIPAAVRRDVALRAGGEPGAVTAACCHWCQRPGRIHWARLRSGNPSAWVSFDGLTLDHVIPEVHGGLSTTDNVVLACEHCNKSRGHRHATPRGV